ncbi:MAG: hypothetical protein JJU36_05130 [Phycisphaeraceae bacterium]|nr:hypothetical protein [Phycisphaeraceae bacterium]
MNTEDSIANLSVAGRIASEVEAVDAATSLGGAADARRAWSLANELAGSIALRRQPSAMTRPKIAARFGRGGLRRRGFTLIEASLTTVIIGTGVLAIMAAQQAYHQQNHWAQRTGTAMLLANEIREMTMHLPHHDPAVGAENYGPELGEDTIHDYNDLDDFIGGLDGAGRALPRSFTHPDGPISAVRQVIPGMEQWEQVLLIENVLPEAINVPSEQTMPLGSTDLMRLTVTVNFIDPNSGDREAVTTLSWLVPRW